ncbi:MAG: homoserine dehydrogenase [Dehalococcoidia bacterium]
MNSGLIVLKFGSSILKGPEQLLDAVNEAYRHIRQGRRVVAVVSAFEGVTGRLIRGADTFGPNVDSHALATLASTGEQVAAAYLCLALEKYGISARIVDPRDIQLLATGDPLESVPTQLSESKLLDQLSMASVVVLPGFFATDAEGRCVLLGRGGSDYSAVFVAHALAAECALLKDVHGIYDHDPRDAGPPTQRYEQIGWADALQIAGRLIQPRAMQFCLDQRQSLSISAPGYPWSTTVGPVSTRPVSILSPPRPLRVVLLGLGTVGRGVYEELKRREDLFDVRRIAVRHPPKHIADGINPALLTSDVTAAVDEHADLVIELMGGVEPATSAIERALERGTNVVTANKGLVASRLRSFDDICRRHGGRLRYSASVGGAAPMIEAVARLQRSATMSGGITSLRGIINGTCNFVLGELEKGSTLPDAIALAQARGFAEQDPSADLTGADAAAKLTILATHVGGLATPATVQCSGIDEASARWALDARARGRHLKLIANLQRKGDQGVLAVGLEEIGADDWLAGCSEERNALEIRTADGAVHQVTGRGAGRYPTTTSVIADVYDVWRGSLDSNPSSPTA